MLTSPYSIYVNKRPLRVAFLVEDRPESMATIDKVLRYNRERWGGRYNPLVVTNGQTLTDTWWSLLASVDPDIVHSFVTLSDELVGLIERRVSPYLIRHPRRPDDEEPVSEYLHLDDDGLSLLPTAVNVRMASWATGESTLVLLDTDWQHTEPLVRRFVEWNFGGYPSPTQAVTRVLGTVQTQAYTIRDASSLVAPFTDLSSFRSFTYPIQLCSIPKEALPHTKAGRFDETFHVVIGDSPSDVAYFWNRPATTPQWSRTYLNQAWLPTAIATDPQLTASLSSWLHRRADPSGSTQARIRFVSLSLGEAELRKIVEPLTSTRPMFQTIDALANIEPPDIAEGPPGVRGQDRMDLYRVTGTTERLTLQEPDVMSGPYAGECWMADVYIEFRPERYPQIAGRDVWWQLPRMNELASLIFRRTARILRSRYPSVLMKRDDARLDINLLDDVTVFALLAASANRAHYAPDARNQKDEGVSTRTPFRYAQVSENGRYLAGLLDLFDGLFAACNVLEEPYWRRMFDVLSGRSVAKDAELIERVGNKLRKRLGANRARFYQDDVPMAWLTNYVVDLVRTLPAGSRDLEFSSFEKEAKFEMESFKALRAGGEKWEYAPRDLIRALARLTERGILQMGFTARCPACGSRAWHHIDDAKQTLRCGGCNATFPMPPERQWHYRLNSLARAAYAQHGLLPVVLVLGQLLMDARSAFLFAPCLDVFDTDGGLPFGDLDLVVILDGRFLIGEVKQSRDLFDEATFSKMETIARRLLPDELLFASMDREPSPFIVKQLKRVSEALQPLGVAVRWYRLHEYKFDPSPVR